MSREMATVVLLYVASAATLTTALTELWRHFRDR